MKKILVTGSNGQLGSEIRAISNKYDIEAIFTDVDVLDICDEDALNLFFESNKNIDFIVNCAAYTAVDKAESDIEKCYNINKHSVDNLINVAQKHGSKIIHISTDYVFDGNHNRPYTEEDKINPNSIYGKSKAEGEELLLKNYPENSIIIRTSWLYSSFGNNFIKTMMRLGRERKEISVVFDQIGTPTNAADLGKTILEIITAPKFKKGIYHFSGEGVCSWYDFAKAIFELKGIECKVNPIESKEYPTPAQRPFYSVLNKAKIKSTYGINIPYWRDSLASALKDFK